MPCETGREMREFATLNDAMLDELEPGSEQYLYHANLLIEAFEDIERHGECPACIKSNTPFLEEFPRYLDDTDPPGMDAPTNHGPEVVMEEDPEEESD